jgi:hypothetical protein
VTGISDNATMLSTKRLSLLQQMNPNMRRNMCRRKWSVRIAHAHRPPRQRALAANPAIEIPGARNRDAGGGSCGAVRPSDGSWAGGAREPQKSLCVFASLR